MNRLVRLRAGLGSAKHVLYQHISGVDGRRLIYLTQATCYTNNDKDKRSNLLLLHHNLHKPKPRPGSSSPDQATTKMLTDLSYNIIGAYNKLATQVLPPCCAPTTP
jgi:hypothetical protein